MSTPNKLVHSAVAAILALATAQAHAQAQQDSKAPKEKCYGISKAGQNVFRDNDYLPMPPDIPAKIAELRPQQGGYKSVIYTPDNLEVDVPRWAKIYDDLFR